MLPAGFDLRAIQIFMIVADLGGMTQAASRLDISQSAVSQAIASLEKLTDTQLFDRNIRPMALTSAGDRLYLHGDALLNSAKNTFNEVRKKKPKIIFKCNDRHVRKSCQLYWSFSHSRVE